MAPPPPLVLDLVQRFDRNRDAYRSPHYNETQVRREFLDPLFKSLGWDMDNEQGYAEAYKDVITRAALSTCGRQKSKFLSVISYLQAVLDRLQAVEGQPANVIRDEIQRIGKEIVEGTFTWP